MRNTRSPKRLFSVAEVAAATGASSAHALQTAGLPCVVHLSLFSVIKPLGWPQEILPTLRLLGIVESSRVL